MTVDGWVAGRGRDVHGPWNAMERLTYAVAIGHRNHRVEKLMRFRTPAVAVAFAIVAATAGGSTAFAAPASATTGPTVTVQDGVAVITGTAARDRITMRTDANELVVDF